MSIQEGLSNAKTWRLKGKKMQFSALDRKKAMLVAYEAWDDNNPLLMKTLMMNQRMKKALKVASWLKRIPMTKAGEVIRGLFGLVVVGVHSPKLGTAGSGLPWLETVVGELWRQLTTTADTRG
ncbi:hypothetical protein Droror1_Dr00011954 [Drosera rotundifolia]